MKVNNKEMDSGLTVLSRTSGLIPPSISTRTDEFVPLLKKWREDHQRVPWACLLKDGLKLALARYAGKRTAHLVAKPSEKKESEVAA